MFRIAHLDKRHNYLKFISLRMDIIVLRSGLLSHILNAITWLSDARNSLQFNFRYRILSLSRASFDIS